MARTKNAKRARVEGESSASARLVASSHYMARWLPSPRALNKYVEKFESREIIPPKAVYSTLNYVVPKSDEEVYHGAKFTRGIAADEEWGEYNRLVGLQSLQYEDPHMNARDILVLWTMVTGKEINWPYFMVHHILEMKREKSSVGLGYAC
ncbi:hypothetical protein S83_060272 [Arachis hypogaea]